MTARLAALALATVAFQAPDDAPLGLSDLAAEHAALRAGEDAGEPPKAATFRDLWDHPDAWRGRRVTVRGRVARVFRQAAVGSFPPLAEAWIEEPPGNLFCAVFAPGEADEPAIAPGARVAFTGTFLRRVRYEADDGGRLAPLVVGPAPPRAEPRPPDGAGPRDFDPQAAVSVWSGATWAVGLGIGLAAIAVMIARLMWNRPAARRGGGRSAAPGPEPVFLDRPTDRDDSPGAVGPREPTDGVS
jgi:hypothetical protein